MTKRKQVEQLGHLCAKGAEADLFHLNSSYIQRLWFNCSVTSGTRKQGNSSGINFREQAISLLVLLKWTLKK